MAEYSVAVLQQLDIQRKSPRGGRFCDVKVVAGDGVEFPAHKNVLAAVSPFFAGIFDRSSPSAAAGENRGGSAMTTVHLKNTNAKSVSLVLDFIYSGKIGVEPASSTPGAGFDWSMVRNIAQKCHVGPLRDFFDTITRDRELSSPSKVAAALKKTLRTGLCSMHSVLSCSQCMAVGSSVSGSDLASDQNQRSSTAFGGTRFENGVGCSALGPMGGASMSRASQNCSGNKVTKTQGVCANMSAVSSTAAAVPRRGESKGKRSVAHQQTDDVIFRSPLAPTSNLATFQPSTSTPKRKRMSVDLALDPRESRDQLPALAPETQVAPFSCKFCHRTYSTANALTRHADRVHAYNPFRKFAKCPSNLNSFNFDNISEITTTSTSRNFSGASSSSISMRRHRRPHYRDRTRQPVQRHKRLMTSASRQYPALHWGKNEESRSLLLSPARGGIRQISRTGSGKAKGLKRYKYPHDDDSTSFAPGQPFCQPGARKKHGGSSKSRENRLNSPPALACRRSKYRLSSSCAVISEASVLQMDRSADMAPPRPPVIRSQAAGNPGKTVGTTSNHLSDRFGMKQCVAEVSEPMLLDKQNEMPQIQPPNLPFLKPAHVETSGSMVIGDGAGTFKSVASGPLGIPTKSNPMMTVAAAGLTPSTMIDSGRSSQSMQFHRSSSGGESNGDDSFETDSLENNHSQRENAKMAKFGELVASENRNTGSESLDLTSGIFGGVQNRSKFHGYDESFSGFLGTTNYSVLGGADISKLATGGPPGAFVLSPTKCSAELGVACPRVLPGQLPRLASPEVTLANDTTAVSHPSIPYYSQIQKNDGPNVSDLGGILEIPDDRDFREPYSSSELGGAGGSSSASGGPAPPPPPPSEDEARSASTASIDARSASVLGAESASNCSVMTHSDLLTSGTASATYFTAQPGIGGPGTDEGRGGRLVDYGTF